MKVILIANVSANGKVLLAEAPNHQPPQEAIGFYIQKALETGNLIIGKRTFDIIQQFPGGVKQIFSGIEVVLLSTTREREDQFKVVSTPEEAIQYLAEKGFTQIVVGGGTQTYNAFLDQGLVTELYLNIIPVITGDGGVLGADGKLFTKFKLLEHTVIGEGIVQLHLGND